MVCGEAGAAASVSIETGSPAEGDVVQVALLVPGHARQEDAAEDAWARWWWGWFCFVWGEWGESVMVRWVDRTWWHASSGRGVCVAMPSHNNRTDVEGRVLREDKEDDHQHVQLPGAPHAVRVVELRIMFGE